MRRDKPKDAYDVVWLLDARGPDTAAEQVTSSPLLKGDYAEDVVGQLRRLVLDQFHDEGSIGPRQCATFLDVDTGDTEPRHAIGTVAAFTQALASKRIRLDG